MVSNGRLLLIVDDDEPTREALREILEHAGHQVVTVSDGAEAVTRMTQPPHPDLAIIDLMMPVMDGWALVSRLRAEPRFASLPVIVVSAFGERALATAPVAAAYLSKPLRAERLLEEVRGALERRGSAAPIDPPALKGATARVSGSAAYPMLQQAAEDAARDLKRLATVEASELARQLREIGVEIHRWPPDKRPTDAERARVTDDLITKLKRAFVLLGRPGTSD